MARFSTRTAWDIRESDLAIAVRSRRESGESVLDLTLSNPTACGFDYESLDLLGALQTPESLVYDPDPRGLLSAREAVVGYYADHGAEVSADRIILTTSTSEAYSFLFRLLCNPGDAVLTGQPGYPLFEFLATLDDVVLTTYPLFYDFGWWIDFAELERSITPRTRALVLVHPNNPTGHATRREQRLKIEEICLRHCLALIVDEVFLDYPVEENSARAGGTFTRPAVIESFACGPHPCLTFVVSGLSKICALPQMKVGWIAAFGPDSDPDLYLVSDRVEALNRLEVIADTFLSLNAPVQHALPTWLARRAIISAQIKQRVALNLAALSSAPSHGIGHMPVEAGWSAVVRIPADFVNRTTTGLAESLLEATGVLLHPGSFYGLAGRSLAVVSLIGSPVTFSEAVDRLSKC